MLQIYADTPLVVRLIDPIKSDEAQAGATYRASLDTPIYEAGHIAIPAYSPCVVQLVDKTDAGHLTGKTTLSLALTKIQIGGQVYDIKTTDSVQASAARGSGSAKITGGTAVAGALIGALAGGVRGAAIGAGSSAAVGTTASLLRPGQKLNLPAETKLTSRLAMPLSVPLAQ